MPFTWGGEFVIRKPWNDVMRAAQTKYPNPFNTSVLSIDVINREIDKETGVLKTTKLINSSWPMLSNCGELRAIERTEIDPRRMYMRLESSNVDMRGVLRAIERLEYEVHPENPEWTLIRHHISVDAFRFIAYAALSTSEKTAALGRETLSWVIENRADNFMKRVPACPPPSFATPVRCFDSNSLPELASCPTSFLWSCLRFFKIPSIRQITAFARGDVSSRWSVLQRSPSLNGLPASFERAISSFDSFNPVEALGGFSHKVASDVNVLTEQLQRRCQRVINRFSKIDEYVLIM